MRTAKIIMDILRFDTDYDGSKPLDSWLLEETAELIDIASTQPAPTTLQFVDELADVRWVAMSWIDHHAQSLRAVDLTMSLDHWIEFLNHHPMTTHVSHLVGLRTVIQQALDMADGSRRTKAILSACSAAVCITTAIAERLCVPLEFMDALSRVKTNYRRINGRDAWSRLTNDQVLALVRHA